MKCLFFHVTCKESHLCSVSALFSLCVFPYKTRQRMELQLTEDDSFIALETAVSMTIYASNFPHHAFLRQCLQQKPPAITSPGERYTRSPATSHPHLSSRRTSSARWTNRVSLRDSLCSICSCPILLCPITKSPVPQPRISSFTIFE